ncbi:uncharacterized protein LOC114526310 isoform X2 [Dendronephthya gigantea]|uniref:uncharacterized protein LOC114526310 isoform X2 n=1 Tax=Dendronephthya gigantea TaxID=151771 RepID=UPI00106AEA6D|nr:uncharacterized protein LOC114526310 isoform X2 [Dendronephthya gigantea]
MYTNFPRNFYVYNGYIHDKRSWLTKPIWGNSSLLRGSDTRSLPPTRPQIDQKFDLSHLAKSHKHFGGGELSYGRSFPIHAKYDVTNLKRSDVRPTDELIPSSNKVNLRSDIINVPFPAEHPQNSHIPKFAVFPAQDSPDDTRSGRATLTKSTSLPSYAPSGSGSVVAEKIRGSPQRREVIRVLSDSERRPLQWHGHSFNQLVKGPDIKKNQFYPTPPTSVKPDFWDRPANLSVSQKTAEAQQRIIDVVSGDTEYTQQYSGNSPRIAGQTNMNTFPAKEKQEKVVLEEKEQPYDTTYGKDYSIDVNTLDSSPPTSILRTASTKKANEAKRNRSVKFSESVTISNGHQTSSGVMNDILKDANHEQVAQRPLTAPGLQRQSILTTNPLLFPTAHQLTLPHTNTSQPRPFSTGVFGSTLRNELRHLQLNYSKSGTQRKFHCEFPENSPDIRRTPDMRITINERRHVIPEIGCHSYYFHG